MDEEGKKELMEEFKKSEGSQRLDMWDYAVSQQVIWEKIGRASCRERVCVGV